MQTFLLLCAGSVAQPPAPPAVPVNPVRNTTVKDKLNAYEGTYVVESGEQDGQPMPKDHFAGATVRITRDKITGTDGAGKKFFDAKYSVDATRTPDLWVLKQDEMTEGASLYALVEQDGPTLKIVYNLPDGPKPTAFKTEKGQHLFVLRRASVDGIPPHKVK